MKVTMSTIEYISDLARLNLTEEEKGRLVLEMNEITSYVEKLHELDTKDVLPMEHVTSMKNVFREDMVEKSYDRDVVLANAPSHENGCFAVPRVVE